MNESWIDKGERDIRDDIVAIAKEETGLTNFKSTGVLRGLVEVITRTVLFIYRTAINPIYANASLDGASGVFLSFWGLMLGVVRKKAERTVGSFTGTAHGDGSLEAGTWARVEGTDLRFRVTQKVRFSAGNGFSIPVEAERPGPDHNIGAGTGVRFTRVVTGLESVSVGPGWIASAGWDEEDDGSYRERIKSRWRGQVLGDTKEVYRFHAEEVPGVKAARVVRTPRGPGTCDVVVAAENGRPSEELLGAVRKNLHAHELMAFKVEVREPGILPVEVRVEYSGDASANEVALVAERYVRGLGIGGRLRIADLYGLYRPLGLATVEILSPERDVQPNEDTVIEAEVTAEEIG